MNTILNFKNEGKMRYMMAGALAAILSFYAVYRWRKSNKTPIQQDSDSEIHEINDRLLYEQNIIDKNQFSFVNYPIQKNPHISNISYKIILNYNKGNIYQGVVKLSFILKSLNSYGKNFKLNYNGTSIKYLSVNGKVLEAGQIQYENHGLFFDKKYLNEKQVNKIEIIFENKYTFLDDGLSSYFILDNSNKYSLKEQVIYMKNGPYEIERIIPCLNILNQCQVTLEVIYPQGFEAFSNSPKSLERLCSIQEYPQYSFFFTLPERGLNKSFKLSSSLSSVSFDSSTLNSSSQTKRNSQFYPVNLASIHSIFSFCSNVIEIQINPGSLSIDKKILIRYFGKNNKVDILQKHISTLNRHIIDICNRLVEYNVQRYLTKVDIFFVADKQIHGYFAPGAIILDQQSLVNGVHIKTFYLIARAILGMVKVIDYKNYFENQKLLQNSPFRNHLSLQVIFELNEIICQKFPQCRTYIFFKQQAIAKARSLLFKKQFVQKYSFRFQQYYYKQTRFMLTQNALNRLEQYLPFQYKDLDAKLKNSDPIAFWSNFITQYNFLSPYIAELLLKISIESKGIPFQRPQIIEFAKKNLSKSKYFLSFFTNEQIQNNLPYFMQGKFHNFQERLSQIKIKQRFREYINDKYQSYLPIKSNKLQSKSIYEQFKKFKQNRNFHHISVLKHQIKRIKMFGNDFIVKEGLNLQCGFMSWKILSKIQIFPSNPDYKKIIYELEQELLENNKNQAKNKRQKDFSQ